MADKEGSLSHANDAARDAYQIGLNYESLPSPFLGNGISSGNGNGNGSGIRNGDFTYNPGAVGNGVNSGNALDANRPQLSQHGSISATDMSLSNTNHSNLSGTRYPVQQQQQQQQYSTGIQYRGRVVHIPPEPGYLGPPTAGVYNKAYSMGDSQVPVSWVTHNYNQNIVQAPPYISAASPSPSPPDSASHIVSGNDNANQTEINPLKNGRRPGNIRNSEAGLNAELHENPPVFDFIKQASHTHSNQGNGNMTNMARGVMNSQEGELPSQTRNNTFTVSTAAPSSAVATLPSTTGNANFQFSNPNSISSGLPVYHHQHHPHYQASQELNRPYYQEFQSAHPNHRPSNISLNHSQQHMHHHPAPSQPQANHHIHQLKNQLIPAFNSPSTSLENSIKSSISSHNVRMQPIQQQSQIHVSKQQMLLQEAQPFVQQHSNPTQTHNYKQNHNLSSTGRKIIKSPATQISNIINHDVPAVSPINSTRNSRSSISSLLSDPIPEKIDNPSSKTPRPLKAEKIAVMADDLHKIGEADESEKVTELESAELDKSIKLNSNLISNDKALPDSKARDGNETPVNAVVHLDPFITSSPADKFITALPVDESYDTSLNESVIQANSVATTKTKCESKVTQKIPAKRGRKPKKVKTQVLVVSDRNKGNKSENETEAAPEKKKDGVTDPIKVTEKEEAKVDARGNEKDRQLFKKTASTSKFITLKINSNKLRNILDAATESTLTSLPPKSGDSELLVLIEERSPKEGNTINNETIEMTNQQLVQLQQNNRQLVSHLDDIKKALPDLFQLNADSIPHLPKGYVPLIMAPNGLLIPMEYISVDPRERKVSIMRPLWEATSGATDADSLANGISTNAIDENVEEIEGSTRNGRKDFGFDNADKLASLQLYLFSKEAKMNMNKVEKVRGCKRFRKQISYYARLLEREQMGFIENYRQERNKCQKMLNRLESGEEMTDTEKDLLEKKDYEMLREEIAKNYNDEHNYLSYLDHVIELESIQCLDYAARLVKLKNYLNMERVRLERHKNRLCRINTNKSHSIWKRYVKTGGNRGRRANVESNSSCGNNSNSNTNWNVNLNLISQNDFMLLTNPNSRAYGTYVLNNSMDKGNENQSEIVELVEYLLPEKSTLRELYREMKRLESDNHDRNAKNTSVNSVQKNDMISKYGLKESNSSTGNRLLRELQIDGMNVDFHKNDRVERRGSGQRKARNSVSSWRHGGHGATRNAHAGSTDLSGVASENPDLHDGEDTPDSSQGDYSLRSAAAGINMLRERSASRSDEQDSAEQEAGAYGGLVDLAAAAGSPPPTVTGTGTGTRNVLNITSCLDPTLRDVDRVKMLNLNTEEIGLSFTRVYGMPKGLRPDEVDADLAYLRSALH